MDFIFDLLQAAGITAAVGIRPIFPVLLAGALASADLGLDFEGTDFAFLEEAWFLGLVAGVGVVLWVVTRRATTESLERGWAAYATAAITGPLALLQGAGSMADRGHPAWIGMVVGLICGSLGLAAAMSLFARVRRRLDAEAASYLPLYGEGVALVACGLSILFPPLALIVLAALVWLLLGSRRREGEKYAGLRILR
jgi:Na+-transporting NADH:ubiquinone oxidoreductase subunit NqrE